jgi:hypothetical protein
MTDAPLRTHALRIPVGDADLPDDRFSDHVNNARYFAFILLLLLITTTVYSGCGGRGGRGDGRGTFHDNQP